MWWPFTLPEPNDARQRRLHGLPAPSNSSVIKPQRYSEPTEPSTSTSERWHTLWTSSRSRQQFAVFAFGAGCMILSSVITRRALARKWASVQPAGMFSPSNKVKDANGGLDAAEALGLATLNVTSFGVMAVGGGLWAFDISNLEELRTKVRKGMDIEGGEGKTEAEAEEDIEEWLGVVLARLQGKNDKNISEMIKEANEKGSFSLKKP
ncbi:hypothetical protein KVT40_007690 [Elsinoe batatas]|uniref:Altered inheritance of mitochondria protein 11 n=1 Tax=Elsinoe batatas TaxID=2601811 RepID=A0A8K0L2J3_9PEZI|nr:hypothetical protein KVT40_007690 [Elsinoe batatas]